MKGLFIPHITAEMFRSGCLESIEALMANGEIYDIDYEPEQRWIPVSEGLPKEYGEYICTMENGQVQECGFVPENQRGLVDGWSTCEADGHKFLGYADVLAWMPLPEPWEEGADE